MGWKAACHMQQALPHLGAANPHALSSILQASEACPIVASEDICDDRGVKLWARGQPVSHALQQRLLDRKLRQPLEACLRAPDGVSSTDLVTATRLIFDGSGPLAHALRPWASQLIAEVSRLPFHPALQLLLTALRASRPDAFEHAIQTMVLTGAMYMHAGSDRYELRLALLAGLAHDIGELYVNPELLTPGHALTPAGYRHVVIHPRIGEMLLTRLTDHPAALARAVGEHHERGNGMGYPLRARHLSWLGCRLSAMEALVGVIGGTAGLADGAEPATGDAIADAWEHGSLALRLIPGEFDAVAISFSSHVARRVRGHAPRTRSLDATHTWERSRQLADRIERCTQAAQRTAATCPPGRVQDNAQLAATLLAQLTQAGHALGVWAPRELLGQDLTELHVANLELAYRLRAIQRITSWLDVGLAPHEEEALAALWQPAGTATPGSAQAPASTPTSTLPKGNFSDLALSQQEC